MIRSEPKNSPSGRLILAALGCGIVALVLGGFLNWTDPRLFLQGYLMAYVLWLGVAVGCLAMGMIYRLTGGRWGIATRRLWEAGAATLPWMALLFLPLAAGVMWIYPWATLSPPEPWLSWQQALQLDTFYAQHLPPETTGSTPEHLEVYLNAPFWLLRAVVYLAVWSLLAVGFNAWSRPLDPRDDEVPNRLRNLSALGLCGLALTFTFAAFDWQMSLSPEWYSSIYGLILIAGGALAAHAWACLLLVGHARRFSDAGEPIPPQLFNDLGNLMLTLVMLWAYVAFSQFLIVWSADLPAENVWYVRRGVGGWWWTSVALIVLHFAVPFLLLLSPTIKQSPTWLGTLAVWLLVTHAVDEFWLTAPSFERASGFTTLWDAVALVGVGGVWFALYAWNLSLYPLEADLKLALDHHLLSEEE